VNGTGAWTSGLSPLWAALALVGAVGPAAADGGAAAARPATHTVVIKATSYAPAALTVRRGDTVVWINEDPFPHTATAAGAFDSKSIAAGGSWKYKPMRAGEFAYVCTFHPNMKGTLSVQ
jgi:plastocyanin